jgi:hypothetical protein
VNISCTKKLLDELNIVPGERVEEDPLFSWHANLFDVGPRKAAILVNDKARYCVLLYNLEEPQLKRFGKIAADAIADAILNEGIAANIAKDYIKSAGKATFTKTNNRSIVASMNQFAKRVESCREDLERRDMDQLEFSFIVNAGRYKIGEGYEVPKGIFYTGLADFANTEKLFLTKVFQLLITLDLDGQKVWRRVYVPSRVTFEKLHFVIQIAMGWQGYHLHEFVFPDAGKPEVSIVNDDEIIFDRKPDFFDYPTLKDTQTKLTDYLFKYQDFEYVYDFGDYWDHQVRVEKVIRNCPINFPLCIGGKGNCPPEDVGGRGGYKEFLEAIGDPAHPDHEMLVEWGQMQDYRDFNINEVNEELIWALYHKVG